MNKNLMPNNCIYFLIVLVVILFFSGDVRAQNKEKEQPINCEYLKLQLDVLLVQVHNKPIATDSGLPPYTIFVISPGDRKDSNPKVAQRFAESLDKLFKIGRFRALRYVIVEAKPRKGYGHLQIYYMDEVQDYPFADNIFECQ